MSAPTIVFAPGTASTITCWPRRWPSFSAMTRLSTSIAPPGLNGETRRIGLIGQAPTASGALAWAEAASQRAKDIAAREAARLARIRADPRSGAHMGISCLFVVGPLFG